LGSDRGHGKIEHKGTAVSGRRIFLPVVVLDRAGWRTAKWLLGRHRSDAHLEFLPSHHPEPRPAEETWPLSGEGLADRHLGLIGGLSRGRS
jgi:hypothetical protein